MGLDLLSIPKDIIEANDGYSFILGATDIFSRFVFAIPLTSKKADVVLQGFKDILATTPRSPPTE